jgi:hypothetical protein
LYVAQVCEGEGESILDDDESPLTILMNQANDRGKSQFYFVNSIYNKPFAFGENFTCVSFRPLVSFFFRFISKCTTYPNKSLPATVGSLVKYMTLNCQLQLLKVINIHWLIDNYDDGIVVIFHKEKKLPGWSSFR